MFSLPEERKVARKTLVAAQALLSGAGITELTDFPAALAAPQIDAEFICEQEPRAE